ncbi:hypothetical protein ACLK1X_17540 [Escherichia coli]
MPQCTRIDTTAIIGELVIGWRGLQRWIVGRHAGVGCRSESNPDTR